MAERARTLRQRLSKKAIDKKSTIQEETKEQKENENFRKNLGNIFANIKNILGYGNICK